jgi:hypothetical protein
MSSNAPVVTSPACEHTIEPAACHFLGDRGRRRGEGEAGVLIPGGGEPVRGEGHGDRAADHEAEAAPAHLRQAGLDVAGELVDHGDRIRGPIGQGQVERPS